MWDILELFADVFEVFDTWRFILCLLMSVAVIGLVYWFVPDRTLCLWLSIPIAILGLGAGALWEWRNR